jgi:cytochrome c peroxidase
MHDGRFKTLAEVLDHYNNHIVSSPTLSPFLKTGLGDGSPQMLGLSSQDKQDLLAFLNMLTDSSFITDKKFADPFNH